MWVYSVHCFCANWYFICAKKMFHLRHKLYFICATNKTLHLRQTQVNSIDENKKIYNIYTFTCICLFRSPALPVSLAHHGEVEVGFRARYIKWLKRNVKIINSKMLRKLTKKKYIQYKSTSVKISYNLHKITVTVKIYKSVLAQNLYATVRI